MRTERDRTAESQPTPTDRVRACSRNSAADHTTFRRTVREGRSTGVSVMKGFAGDPNVEPYADDMYAYLQARADGELDRGRPVKMGE